SDGVSDEVSGGRGARVAGAELRDDLDLVRLRRGDLDTKSAPRAEPDSGASAVAMYVVQFVGPTRDAWRAEAESAGLDLVAPVPNDALLVRGAPGAVARFAESPFVQWCGPYGRAERLDPALDGAVDRSSAEPVPAA